MEIYAYQNVAALTGIFNAIAAIVGSTDYKGAIAVAAFFGFGTALLAYAFAPERLVGWKWLASVVLIYSIMFVPRVPVQIIDKTGGSPPVVVDNIPFGLALFGSMTSQVGNVLTELFETALQTIPGDGQLPSELSYQRTGLMFGSRLVRYSQNLTFVDPIFRTDLIAFIDNCTKFDLMDGTIDPTVFAKSDNVWELMKTPNPARLTPITTGPGASTVATCPTAYAVLDARMGAQLSLLQGSLAQQLNPSLPAAAAATAIGPQMVAAYSKNALAAASTSANRLILQNAMINAINDTSSIIGQRTNDPASMMLAVGRAQAVAQTNASWITYGKVAEEALPLIRNVIEAIIYAVFPIVILLLLLTNGPQTMKALGSYGLTLLWIQMWPPLYAVLNYMGTIVAASKIGAAANIGGATALSMQTASTVYSTAVSIEAVVGYMVLSIPAIGWAVLKGMETIGQAALTGTSSLASTISGSAGSAALGNVSGGNISMEQQSLAPNRSSPFMRTWMDDRTGNTWHTGAFGVEAVDQLSNSGFVSHKVSMSVGDSEVKEANRLADAARTDVHAYQSQVGATLTNALNKFHGSSNSGRSTSGWSTSDGTHGGKDVNDLVSNTQTVAHNEGTSFQAVSDLGVRLGLNAVGNGGTVSKTFQDGLSVQDQKLMQSLGSQGVQQYIGYVHRAMNEGGFISAVVGESGKQGSIAAQLSDQVSNLHRAEESYSERVGLAERLSQAKDRRESFEIDMARDPYFSGQMMEAAERYGNSPSAFYAYASSVVAQRGLSPSTFSDGSMRPETFADLQKLHDEQAKDREGDVRKAHSTNIDTVNRTKMGGGGKGTNHQLDLSNQKAAVDEIGNSVNKTHDIAKSVVNNRVDIDHTRGAPTSKHSQVEKVGKAAASEALRADKEVKDAQQKAAKEFAADPAGTTKKVIKDVGDFIQKARQ